MEIRQAVVGSSVGLHARPAAVFVQAVTDSGHAVTIGRPGDVRIDARSILSVMGLGAAYGDIVEIAVEGADEAAVADELTRIVESNLDG